MTEIVETLDMQPENAAHMELSSTASHPIIAAGQAVLETILDSRELETLEDGRAVLDQLHFSLYAVMAARGLATEKIGEIKAKDPTIPPVDSVREKRVLAEGKEAAAVLDIDASAVQGLLLAMIGHAHAQHKAARQQGTLLTQGAN